jgi:hypothetical protein
MTREGVRHAAAIGLALLLLGQAYFGSLGKSLTWDEPGYIAAGYANWTWNDYRLNEDHPPLMQKLQGLGLLFLSIDAPLPGDARYLDSENPRATYGRDLVFFRDNDLVAITRWGRAPVMLLGAALVLCVYAWGRRLLGPEPALLGASLVALSPNLVAHAKLATEDLGCATLFFAAVWLLWRSVESPSPANRIACGVVTGLALLSKYTALLLGPIFLVLSVVAWRRRGGGVGRWAAHLGVLAGIAFVVVGLAYGARFRPDLFFAGITKIYPDVADNYLFYFWGSVHDTPRWYHALASWVIKTPVPVLLLFGAALIRAARSRGEGEALWFLLFPPALVMLASFFDATNPGLRRVLPALPFLLLFAGGSIRGAASRRLATAAILVAWLAVESFRIYPHHLSYVSQAFGGPERGPYLFDESNIDWGQDLPALAKWQARHHADAELPLLYFGSASPAAYGVHATELDLRMIEDPPPGSYAISAHYLGYLRKLSAREGIDADWLGKYQPIARAGHSIYIYRFPVEGSGSSGPAVGVEAPPGSLRLRGGGPRPSR